MKKRRTNKIPVGKLITLGLIFLLIMGLFIYRILNLIDPVQFTI